MRYSLASGTGLAPNSAFREDKEVCRNIKQVHSAMASWIPDPINEHHPSTPVLDLSHALPDSQFMPYRTLNFN